MSPLDQLRYHREDQVGRDGQGVSLVISGPAQDGRVHADDVAVMYASKIAEKASVNQIFENPLHPYTRGLLKSLPKMGAKQKRLDVIAGSVPDPLHFPTGCNFHPRCPYGKDDAKCRTQEPKLEEFQPGHQVACWKAKEILKKEAVNE